jgi:hypothetical protein
MTGPPTRATFDTLLRDTVLGATPHVAIGLVLEEIRPTRSACQNEPDVTVWLDCLDNLETLS